MQKENLGKELNLILNLMFGILLPKDFHRKDQQHIAAHPKPVLSEESDDDPGCDGYVSEPHLVAAVERSTLEFTMDRDNQLDLTDEPGDSLQEVSIIPGESITESSVTRPCKIKLCNKHFCPQRDR